METIDLEYLLIKKEEGKIINTTIADQKDIIEQTNDILVKGYFLIDFLYESEIVQHEKIDFNFTLNKCKYHLKDIKLSIDDYHININENNIKLNIKYLISGSDVALERFCFLENDDLANELRDYLHRNEEEKQVHLDEEKIVLLDPIIEEEKTPVEIPQTQEPIFKEKYSSSYLFYRVKKNETVEMIAKKFHVNEEVIYQINKKEIKENVLIQIPYHV